jgi:hypothetical protein
MLTVLTLITALQLAAASPYSAGYSHGCDDGKVGFHKYLKLQEKELITTLLNLCKDIALVQMAVIAIVVAVIAKLVPNQQIRIQQVRLYHAINRSILQNTAMDIAQEQYNPMLMMIQMRILRHLKFHVKVVGLVQNTAQDINKGMQTRTMQCFLLLTRLI